MKKVSFGHYYRKNSIHFFDRSFRYFPINFIDTFRDLFVYLEYYKKISVYLNIVHSIIFRFSVARQTWSEDILTEEDWIESII